MKRFEKSSSTRLLARLVLCAGIGAMASAMAPAHAQSDQSTHSAKNGNGMVMQEQTTTTGAQTGTTEMDTPRTETPTADLEGAPPATTGQTGATGAAGQTGTGAGQTGATGAAGQTGAGVPATVLMLVPVETAAQQPAMKGGCWARIHDRENYLGDTLTLAGPIALADMTMGAPFGLNWDDRVNSIEVGPGATVTVFDNENYRDQVAQFKGGQRVPDLSRRLGFFDEFASIRIDCQGR